MDHTHLWVRQKLNTKEKLYYLRNFQTLLEKVANKHFFLEATRNQKHKIFLIVLKVKSL